ncbi:hypothetical protein B0H67DRAFT_553084 [Lasiosphaeris hirsuta]|uniref:Uncharacterized protein n=1 Tax=Lasiosphaeris hirsuta TaxID=260670 RepID=A0AA40AS82_9PEZI|nr:hypothetical protein B0H67DRAFT_553084 [Lasiosphaeris hirsuta]
MDPSVSDTGHQPLTDEFSTLGESSTPKANDTSPTSPGSATAPFEFIKWWEDDDFGVDEEICELGDLLRRFSRYSVEEWSIPQGSHREVYMATINKLNAFTSFSEPIQLLSPYPSVLERRHFPMVLVRIMLNAHSFNAKKFANWLLRAPSAAKGITIEGAYDGFSIYSLDCQNAASNAVFVLPDSRVVSDGFRF